MGQVVWLVSHSSMHDWWNSCLQVGSRRSISSISYSPRHTLHVSPLWHDISITDTLRLAFVVKAQHSYIWSHLVWCPASQLHASQSCQKAVRSKHLWHGSWARGDV